MHPQCCDLSPDAPLLAVGLVSGAVHVRSLAYQQEEREEGLKVQVKEQLTATPHARRPEQQQQQQQQEEDAGGGDEHSCRAVRWLPGSPSLLASGGEDRALVLTDVQAGGKQVKYRGSPPGAMGSRQWRPCGAAQRQRQRGGQGSVVGRAPAAPSHPPPPCCVRRGGAVGRPCGQALGSGANRQRPAACSAARSHAPQAWRVQDAHDEPVSMLRALPGVPNRAGGCLLVSGDDGGGLKLWDVRAKKQVIRVVGGGALCALGRARQDAGVTVFVGL